MKKEDLIKLIQSYPDGTEFVMRDDHYFNYCDKLLFEEVKVRWNDLKSKEEKVNYLILNGQTRHRWLLLWWSVFERLI